MKNVPFLRKYKRFQVILLVPFIDWIKTKKLDEHDECVCKFQSKDDTVFPRLSYQLKL